jgi:hypothetical protein
MVKVASVPAQAGGHIQGLVVGQGKSLQHYRIFFRLIRHDGLLMQRARIQREIPAIIYAAVEFSCATGRAVIMVWAGKHCG